MFKIKYWIFIRVSIPIFQIRLDCSKLKGNGVRLTVSWHGKLVRSVWANPQMKVVHSVHTWPRRKPQSHPITITLEQAVEPRGKSRRNLKKETKKQRPPQSEREKMISDVGEDEDKWLAAGIAGLQQNAFYMHRALVTLTFVCFSRKDFAY